MAKKNSEQKSRSLPQKVSDLGGSLSHRLSLHFKTHSSRIIDLNYGFPLTMSWSALSSLIHGNEVRDYSKRVISKYEADDGVVPLDTFREFALLKRRASAANSYVDRIPHLYITSLIEEWDQFAGKMIRILLDDAGGAAKLGDKSLKYSELLNFTSFEEAKQAIIENEVDRVLREGIYAQFEWFNGQGLKIPLDHPTILAAFELNERRNCIVHNGSKVNRFYLDNCLKRKMNWGNRRSGS